MEIGEENSIFDDLFNNCVFSLFDCCLDPVKLCQLVFPHQAECYLRRDIYAEQAH